MIAACLLAHLFVAPVPPLPPPLPAGAFLDACHSQRLAVTAFLADDANWAPGKKAELILTLRVAGVVRPPEALAGLMTHIAYRDDAYDQARRESPPELEYPVYGALSQYGAAAIPEAIAHLKRANPPTDELTRNRESYLFALLLSGLSDEQDVGKAMARVRIQAEFQRFPQADFPRLKALLKNQMLK